MAPNPIKITTLAASLALVAVIEWTAPWLIHLTDWPVMTILGFIRIIEIGAMIGIVRYFETGLGAMGWGPHTWIRGIGIGALWSLGFALAAAAAMAVLYAMGQDALMMLRTRLPGDRAGLVTFFLVGGLIGPLAEEICFRGLAYTFFRRWGVVVAIIASTLVFVALHSVHGFPLVQIIGGLVFALSFEVTGNLMVPIVIHVLGNSAIFALSLPWAAG
jgi:membrane protease YdiL (CAAX protease family)